MKTYRMHVTAIYGADFNVEAKDEETAKEIAELMFENGELEDIMEFGMDKIEVIDEVKIK
mgnify:CR=1 FL=1